MAKPDDDGRWLDPEAVEPRFMLFATLQRGDVTLGQVGLALDLARPAALVLDARRTPDTERLSVIGRYRDLTREADTALLIWGDPVLVIETGADGVHLDEVEILEPARRLLGPERLIGCACGLSRHLAMEAGEAGADYVLFGELGAPAEPDLLAEHVRWWADLFVLPCAAAAAPEPGDVAALVRGGADFVALGGRLWVPEPELGPRLETLIAAMRDQRPKA